MIFVVLLTSVLLAGLMRVFVLFGTSEGERLRKNIGIQIALSIGWSGILFCAGWFFFSSVSVSLIPLLCILLEIGLLGCVVEADLREQSIYLLVVGMLSLCAIISHLVVGDARWLSWLGACFVGALFFGVQHLISRGKAIGTGDIYLGMGIGLMLGMRLLLLSLLCTYVLGAVIALLLLALGKMKRKDPFPIGACLAVVSGFVLLFGDMLVHWLDAG